MTSRDKNLLAESVAVLTSLVRKAEAEAARNVDYLREEFVEEIDQKFKELQESTGSLADRFNRELEEQECKILNLVDEQGRRLSETLKTDSIVFESSIQDLRSQASNLQDQSAKDLLEAREQLLERLSEAKRQHDSLVTDLSERIAGEHKEILQQISAVRLVSEENQETTLTIRRDLSSSFQDLERKILDTDQRALERSVLHQTQFEENRTAVASLKASVEKQIASLEAWYKTALDQKIVELNRTLNAIQDYTKKTFGKQESTLLDITKRISSLGSLYAPLRHDHDADYAPLKHSHQEYAKVVHDHPGLQSQISAFRTELTDSLRDKVSKTDLDALVAEISQKAASLIPKPVDGKDGLDWSFEFDPKQRGLLWYKRSDWKDWRSENLLGQRGKDGIDSKGGGGGFGGGTVPGSGSASFTTKKYTMSGYVFDVAGTTHKITDILSVIVLNAAGYEVSVVYSVNISNDIHVDSLVDLSNHTITIKGTI